MANDKTHLKAPLLEALRKSMGVAEGAINAVGISRKCYNDWCRVDPEFRAAVDDIKESRVDFAELKLYQLVQEGNIQAVMFVLKTVGMKRGWNDKYAIAKTMKEENKKEAVQGPHRAQDVKAAETREKKKLVKALRAIGSYSDDLTMQIDATAQLIVAKNMIWRELTKEGFAFTKLEVSREGVARESVNDKVQLYINLNNQAQMALRRLGLNFDAKDRKAETDDFREFMKEMEGDGDGR